MIFDEIKQLDDTYVMHTYGRFPIAFDHGKGATLYDVSGKAYIDLTAGIGVNCLGHDHPKLTKALTEQMHKLMHVSNLYYTEPYVRAAKLLCEKSGMKRVFFGNSGAEANEGLIKLARKYSYDKYGEGRAKIVTLVNSFHGRTVTTLKATGQEQFHQYFYPFTEGFDYAQPDDLEDLKAKCDDKTCAVLMELIQGESGVRLLDPDYVRAAEAFCKEHDILFLVDEVQTGIGRTGALFSYQKYGVHPDAISMAKGLAGGLPVGGFAVGGKLMDVLGPGTHGSTFGGNAMSMTGACVVLEEVTKPEFLKSVEEKGIYLMNSIRALNSPAVAEVRGMGLMIGIVLKDPSKRSAYVNALMQEGVIVLTAGKDVIRLLPPLVITQDEMDCAIQAFKKVLV